MKPEVERCGEEAALYNTITLDRVIEKKEKKKKKEEEEKNTIIAGVRCQARCRGKGYYRFGSASDSVAYNLVRHCIRGALLGIFKVNPL
jgi:hypothetical protein